MICKSKLIIYNYCHSVTSEYFILPNYKFVLFKAKPETLFVNVRIDFTFAKNSFPCIYYKYKNQFSNNISSTFYEYSQL